MSVYMFRELLHHTIQSITQSGQCSLCLQSAPDPTKLFVSFWSGNILNYLLLAEFPPSLCEAKKILEIISCFLAVPSDPVVIYSLLGFDARTVKTLTFELNQTPSTCVVPTFNYEDLYKVLAGPAIRILNRYDLHSILRLFSMKLRTALDSAWLNSLPELRIVNSQTNLCHYLFVIISTLKFSIASFGFPLFSFLYCSRKLPDVV